jgi:sigma-B regulation protein RsbU (phosphoserine phosphatase)
VTLITYTFPVYDASGRIAGVVGVDLESEWLGNMLNARHMFPSSYDILISGEGKLICGPKESGNSHQLAKETVSMINDSTLQRHVSSSGNSTLLSFIDKEDGSNGSVFYSSPKSLKPWKIAVVNYDDEVFEPLLKMSWRNLFLTLAGLLVLAFIIQRSAKNISKLQQANLEREHIDSELNIARKIQMDMIPKVFPPFPERNDINIYGSLVPAKVVGGDLYDFFIRDEKLYFCIGDVSGKSVPGALVMAAGYTLYHSLAAHESNPSRIMQALNEALSKDNETNMFVTMFIGVLDLPTGKLRYCNAGHEHPFIIGQKVRALPVKPHLPLGVVDDMIYTTQEDFLAKGEMVFLYTDGLTEAKDMKHEQFGLKRVESILETFVEQGGIPTEALIHTISEKVAAFVGDAEQSDDLTLLAIQYTPQEKPIVLHESLTLTNKVSEITKLNTFVKSATTALNLETDLANKIKLAVEEAVTNCIEYSYPIGTVGDVVVDIEADDSTIRFIITDSGADFDPTKVSKADTTLSVDERPIGGLGVFLVRNLMDSINYERIKGKNVLRMEKRYS